MFTKTQWLGLSCCFMMLSGCMIDDGQISSGSNEAYMAQNSLLYPEGYENVGTYGYQTEYKKEVVVPESYHVGAYHSPSLPKDVDKTWVSNQSSTGYTIELADDEKASHVAGVLQKAPKNERMAEVKYQRDGKAYYKGLYGTYPTQEAAEDALKALPDEVKQGAGIKNWGSVQQSVNE
jgi:septal ring-binding cell division protein DamX